MIRSGSPQDMERNDGSHGHGDDPSDRRSRSNPRLPEICARRAAVRQEIQMTTPSRACPAVCRYSQVTLDHDFKQRRQVSG